VKNWKWSEPPVYQRVEADRLDGCPVARFSGSDAMCTSAYNGGNGVNALSHAVLSKPADLRGISAYISFAHL